MYTWNYSSITCAKFLIATVKRLVSTGLFIHATCYICKPNHIYLIFVSTEETKQVQFIKLT